MVETRYRRAYADASWTPFWLDRPDRPPARPALEGESSTDLAIVGGGFTGLWAALQAVEDTPGRDVVLLEGERIAFGATGRNGGFCDASLTHGLENGRHRFPDEIERIEQEGRENFEQIVATIDRFGIECSWETNGSMMAATAPHAVEWCRSAAETLSAFGYEATFLDRDEVRAEVHSPTYEAAVWKRTGSGLTDPARLAWGLADAAERLGVRIHEHAPVTGIDDEGETLVVRTAIGRVRARRVILGTNAYPPLARSIRRYILPVYDHVLMTEPLSIDQKVAVGWSNRQGLSDMANRFHYYRLSDDDRILWGGYDAIYHWNDGVDPRFERRDATYDVLARHFFETFPQLEGVRFTHAWAGAIDTCSRFSVFFGREFDGKLAYAAGYTGLGVGATRWGARVCLDLVDELRTARTQLSLVRTKPLPFPPEPFRSAGVWVTRRALARADRRKGRRGPWLKLLDAAGLGFDS
jgi:glycine/D-amino acid oxidase-like deaminating enzyme